jgi:hypothetical protein
MAGFLASSVGPCSAICGRWLMLSHGHSNVGFTQEAALRARIMSDESSAKAGVAVAASQACFPRL